MMPHYPPPDYADNDERQMHTNPDRLVYQTCGLDEGGIRVIAGRVGNK